MNATPYDHQAITDARVDALIEPKPLSHIESLLTRRSPKLTALRAPEPDVEELQILLTAASRVPDHGSLVPWRFIVIRGDRRDALSKVIRRRFDEVYPDASAERREKMTGRMCHAPLVIAVVFCPRSHPKIPDWEQQLAVGAVCMNLLHACRSIGFAGLWLSEWYAYDDVVLDELRLVDHERLAGFIHIGTSAGPREERVRPTVNDISSDY